MNDKIKAMLEAKCAILDCEEKQFMFLGLPSSMGNDIQQTYPFCEKHFMAIMMHKIGSFTLKAGNKYGTKLEQKKAMK